MGLSCNRCGTENWRAASLIAFLVCEAISRQRGSLSVEGCCPPSVEAGWLKCNLSPLQVGVSLRTSRRLAQHVQTSPANIAGYLQESRTETLLSPSFRNGMNKTDAVSTSASPADEKVSQYRTAVSTPYL